MARRRWRLFAQLGVGAILLAGATAGAAGADLLSGVVGDDGPVPVARKARRLRRRRAQPEHDPGAHPLEVEPGERLRPPHVHPANPRRHRNLVDRAAAAPDDEEHRARGRARDHSLDAVVLPLRRRGRRAPAGTPSSSSGSATGPGGPPRAQAGARLQALRRLGALGARKKGPPLGDPFKKNRR